MPTSKHANKPVRIDKEVIFLLCAAASAINGIHNKISMGGFVNPISQARCSKLRQASQIEVVISRHQIKNPLGTYKSSQKNISDEISKKQVKKGPKINVLNGVSSEIGNPHPMRNGREMNDIKSCSCMFFRKD